MIFIKVSIVTAQHDAYQPSDDITPPHKFYPGCSTSVIPEGHIRSYLFYQHVFREAIYRVVDKMIFKSKNSKQAAVNS